MNIPYTNLKRVVIIGAGFAGLEIAKRLNRNYFQVVLLDKNNYHTFKPLLYQVATYGLEPDSIACSIRTIIKNKKNFFFRLAQVNRIDTNQNKIYSNIGDINYDYLIIATGSVTNFFGKKNIESLSLTSIHDALDIRSIILQKFETAILTNDVNKRKLLMTFVIVGGGPTGVELAGSLAEMKKVVLPRDYPDIDINHMNIHLIQASNKILEYMSEKSSSQAFKDLKELGVNILLNSVVTDYNGKIVNIINKNIINNSISIESSTVIWAAGVKGAIIDGLDKLVIEHGRFLVDNFNKIKKYENIFAIGDVAMIKNEKFPKGHPMTVQPAIQQGIRLAKNLNNMMLGKKMQPFNYVNMGYMAIIGRNKAVCDLRFIRLKGFIAWFIWIIIHIINLVGFRNKIIALANCIIQYNNYNKSIMLKINNNKK
ncbi:MAG: NAD(P)/FAD-dependent oxidoreductase [Candidatus Bostrichicola ureolyticus]|nr:MAG: NAD(P)/FAD-dependent oxidoreductase [Candidatus Bostrichicola ureolyticus]